MSVATTRRSCGLSGLSVIRRLLLACVASLMLLGHAWAVVDINSADEKQLRTVKGIGPVKAKALLNYRAKNGSFHSVTELRKVKGFGAKTLARIGANLSISGRPVAPSATSDAKPVPTPRGRH